MKRVIRLTQPTAEPITLAEAEAHLRIDTDSTESVYVESLISAARDYCERFCNRSWASANFIQVFDRFPLYGGIKLTDVGATALLEIKYIDESGAPVTMSLSGITLDTDMGVIDSASGWPTGSRIKVSYTAGPDAGASVPERVPESISYAIKLVLTDFYENRASQQWQAIYSNAATDRLMQPYRVGLGV